MTEPAEKPGRLFCFGMPKCGTTTVSGLLDAHPAICLHSQKEPGDFLRSDATDRLSGYAVDENTRWLADFTTTYGLSDKRDLFFTALRGAGIAPTQARYVLCLRDPVDLGRSYLRHIAERRFIDVTVQVDDVRREILSACDMVGAVEHLQRAGGPDAGFVVVFDDLINEAAQRDLAQELFAWLNLDQPADAASVWANAGGSASRYPAVLDRMAGVLRRTDIVRGLSPATRARLRSLFARPTKAQDLPPQLIEDTMGWLEEQETVQAARALLQGLRSGPIDKVVPKTGT